MYLLLQFFSLFTFSLSDVSFSSSYLPLNDGVLRSSVLDPSIFLFMQSHCPDLSNHHNALITFRWMCIYLHLVCQLSFIPDTQLSTRLLHLDVPWCSLCPSVCKSNYRETDFLFLLSSPPLSLMLDPSLSSDIDSFNKFLSFYLLKLSDPSIYFTLIPI